jgi:hypothetical protein
MWTIHGHDSFENSKGENAKCCPPMPQALSIKGDVTLGIPQSRPLGRKWRCVGVERPSAGEVVSNPALESALPTKVNFTQKEWAAFGIRERTGANGSDYCYKVESGPNFGVLVTAVGLCQP